MLTKRYYRMQNVFGLCHLSPNFHMLLHIQQDFKAHSTLSTHWLFPFERVNQEILTLLEVTRRSSVTKSLAMR